MMATSKATMATVAKLAGVSSATVARVIYEEGYVKASTREAVLEAVRKTSYRPNVVARSLRTRRTTTLGLVSESELNPFFTKVAKSIQLQALAKGYTVLTLNHNGVQSVEKAGVQQLIDQHVGAIMFCSAISPEAVKVAANAGHRVVQIEREVAAVGSVVLVDPVPGMRSAIQHLVELGHQRIAYIGGALIPGRSELPVEQSNEALRISAFKTCLSDAGLRLHEGYVQLGRYFDPATGLPSDGATLMRAVLELSDRPTAVIVGSDLIASGALQAIHRVGLRVPDDLSVVGYDDSLANVLTPPLTTIAQPMEDLGKFAIEIATMSATEAAASPREVVLPTRLVIRESTAEPRR
jgi:DNA-binding LacI/PurR family transcriptional regulator